MWAELQKDLRASFAMRARFRRGGRVSREVSHFQGTYKLIIQHATRARNTEVIIDTNN